VEGDVETGKDTDEREEREKKRREWEVRYCREETKTTNNAFKCPRKKQPAYP
jgi:hypothetical protein